MPDYPCAVCGETVELQKPPTRGETRCPTHRKALQVEQTRRRRANKAGEGVRFTAGKPKQERRPPAFPPVYARDWPAGTPVAVGAQCARVVRVVRRYGVVLLDRQIGKYATYEPCQLRKLTTSERAAFEWREKLYEKMNER